MSHTVTMSHHSPMIRKQSKAYQNQGICKQTALESSFQKKTTFITPDYPALEVPFYKAYFSPIILINTSKK